MTEATSAAATSPSPFAGGDWFDPLEEAVRRQVRAFIEELLEEELEAALGRGRYARLRTAAEEPAATAAGLGNGEAAAGSVPSAGHRHGRRERQVMGSFGAVAVAVPRARLDTADGRTTEWVNKTLPAYAGARARWMR